MGDVVFRNSRSTYLPHARAIGVPFAITVLLMLFPFTWLYVDSRASVVAVALMHSALNATGDTFTSSDTLAEIRWLSALAV